MSRITSDPLQIDKKIKGDFGAKYMVKRLKNKTNFIEVRSKKIFRDFDKISDFRR